MSYLQTKARLLQRYASVLLLNPAMGGLLLCSVVVVAGAALLWPKAARHEFSNAKPATPRSTVPVVHAAVVPVAARRAESLRPVAKVPQPTIFDSATMNAKLQPVSRFADVPAQEVMRHISVREMIDSVVPYAPFHYGVDHPLPNLLTSLFANSQIPVEVRAGRYLLLTHSNAPGGRGREFLWVDTRDGVGIGGIFFYPANGEPSPTLTLFSNQVKGERVEIRQMPVEFLRELRVWETQWNVPEVTVRYFVNAEGRKSVLAHEEDFCVTAAKDVCKKMNADAAELDQDANYFLGKTHYASNATGRMIGNSE